MKRDRRRMVHSALAGTRAEDWLAAGAFLLVAEFEIWVEPVFENGLPGPRVPLALLTAIALLPLAWRRRFPLPAVATMTGSLVLVGALGEPEQSGLEFALALMLAIYSVAAQRPLPQAALGALIVAVGTGVYEWLTWVEGDSAVDVAVPYLLFAAAWIAGREVREHREQATALAARAALLEEAHSREAELAVAEERRRIARELHDVVGHGISLMGLQAAAARRTLAPDQHDQREALLIVETVGREALAEMNRMLGLLRRDGEPGLREPQPALSALPRLITEAREAGMDVALIVEGEPGSLRPGLELTAYRVIQEALTNVRKHAPGASARVHICYRPGFLDLRIENDGPRPTGEPPTTGHGLLGMRERVALHGGQFSARPGELAGFLVEAHLPVEP